MKNDLHGRCIRCIHFTSGYKRGYGICHSTQAFKEITGKSFRAGAPEGPSMEVRKLDGCSFWKSAW